ncbi:MAG: hypothetical protein LC624_05565 [Halobacteriales archaeon]|nr:hypothetical protein [Halobacteriales archaeon]
MLRLLEWKLLLLVGVYFISVGLLSPTPGSAPPPELHAVAPPAAHAAPGPPTASPASTPPAPAPQPAAQPGLLGSLPPIHKP